MSDIGFFLFGAVSCVTRRGRPRVSGSMGTCHRSACAEGRDHEADADSSGSNSSATTEKRAPIHPGAVLKEDFIDGFGIAQSKLAVSIGVPLRHINEIVHGKRAITAEAALRLGRCFGIHPQVWLNLQTHLNLQAHLELELAEDRVLDQIAAITPLEVV